MENSVGTNTEWNFNKRVEGYDQKPENFVVPMELTVTITLAEYRSLVSQDAKQKADKANLDWLKEHQKVKELEEEIAHLKDTIARMAIESEGAGE